MDPGRLDAGSGTTGRPGRPRPAGPSVPLLRITNLSKTFLGTRALNEVSLDVHSGEVLAVVGQNGSGKSTLVKVLAGVHEPDPGGSVLVRDPDGRLVPAHGAHRQSLHFIHQDLGLLPTLSTTENLDLGRPLGRRGLLPGNRAEEHRRAERLIGRFGTELDVRAPVGGLSPAERAIVAIARALDGWTRPDNVLVLDEPTTAFHSGEVQRLFEAVRRVADEGAGIIFISHRLDEVRELADRVAALRDGRLVAQGTAAEFDHDALIRAIVGSALAETRKEPVPAHRPTVLDVDALAGRRLHGVGLTVRQGEILGVGGVLGSGREDLAALLFGAQPRTGGRVRVDGRVLPGGDVAASIGMGLAFVPADRHRHGAVMELSMRENLTLPGLAPLRRRFGRIDLAAERAESRQWSAAVELRPAEPERPLSRFSGGNQQKVVLARWLRMRPAVLLLDEPTQGVDIGAKAAIYALIRRAAAEQGTAVLVCSSDSAELAELCDRVVVLQDGQVTAEVEADQLSEEALLRASLGVSRRAGATAAGGGPGEEER
ncbi:MAG TPA: sugar ABC transporter ATP-binding protein [Actinocrinis sp.]|nr:sugar ABC transporter ATP-binding protein [Actinocrinis sp.]